MSYCQKNMSTYCCLEPGHTQAKGTAPALSKLGAGPPIPQQRGAGTYLGAHLSVVVLEGQALLWAGSQDLPNCITLPPVQSCCFSTSTTYDSSRNPGLASKHGQLSLKPGAPSQKLDFELLLLLLNQASFRKHLTLRIEKGKLLCKSSDNGKTPTARWVSQEVGRGCAWMIEAGRMRFWH